MPHTLDAAAVRSWCSGALRALGAQREELDATNVFPIADGDTGTNLYLTLESASQAVEAVFAAHETDGSAPEPADALRAMAHGALLGARGNSGTILSALLRGMAEVLADLEAGDTGEPGRTTDEAAGREAAGRLARALARAAKLAREAVARPVEGTILTVADAAADAAGAEGGDIAATVRAAHAGACAALDATPEQLPALARAGVVDAGGRGLLAVLGALAETLAGHPPPAGRSTAAARPRAGRLGREAQEELADTSCPAPQDTADGPAYEVIYLLEATDAAVVRLRMRLGRIGDCLVVVGGDGLWKVHVHVDDAGAAVEAGVEAGRPSRIRITHFPSAAPVALRPREQIRRAVVAVVPGEGLAGLCGEAGATTVVARRGEPPASGELVEAIGRAHAREVVLLPNDPDLWHTADAAAAQARRSGVRVALIPTRAAVQGIAALAVHQPERPFDEDVVAMTAAAGATRYGELAVAARESWTTAGVCQAGDVLGLIDGDVAVIGSDLAATAEAVLDRMLSAGGELVTLVLGEEAGDDVGERLTAHVREGYLAVDTVVHTGGGHAVPLLIGVE